MEFTPKHSPNNSPNKLNKVGYDRSPNNSPNKINRRYVNKTICMNDI